MKHLTILVDMDDTIENLLPAWVDYLNKKHGTNVHPDDVKQWNVAVSFPSLSVMQVYQPLYIDSFWRTVKPKDGAVKALEQLLVDGHKVVIVTSSAYETLCSKMKDVLFRYFPFISWEDVIITAHKQLIRGDVLVDDGVHNLEGGEYLKVLFDAPHNREYDAEGNGMHRVFNWAEAYELIKSYARTNGR